MVMGQKHGLKDYLIGSPLYEEEHKIMQTKLSTKVNI